MIDIKGSVSYLNENRQWQTLNYPNLELTSQRLKDCRKNKSLTLSQLSKALRINLDYLSNLESSESLMGPGLLQEIADFYNKPIAYFTCSNEYEFEQLRLF